MTIKTIKEKIFYFLAVSLGIFFLFFFITNIWIGHEAKRLCQEAEWEYQKNDCVEALIATLDDENQGYRTRITLSGHWASLATAVRFRLCKNITQVTFPKKNLLMM